MKIFKISSILVILLIVVSCSSNSTKKSSGNEANDSTETTIPAPLEALENDTVENDAIKRVIFLAYYDPTLTPESERVYSKTMLNQFKQFGFNKEVKRTDLMSDDFKKTWNQFNNLDPETVMEFLDWDLFFCGQDIYDLNVTIENILVDTETSATANIIVINGDQTTPVAVKLIKNTADEWKIDDMTWKGSDEFVKQPMKKYTASH